jgi:peptidoglycan/LPS O-acetylase OafA/YrhL
MPHLEESFPLASYHDAPEKDTTDPSPSSTSTKLTTITEYDEIGIRRLSTDSASTAFSDLETEDLLAKEAEVSQATKKRWSRRCKSWSTSRPVKIISPVLLALIPSFFRKSEKRKLYPTSYLDGLRGVAAFFVTQVRAWLLAILQISSCFLQDHLFHDWFPILFHGYDTVPDSNHFMQLPILRCWYSGSGMVCVFFVISGYVLANKSLQLMRSRPCDFSAIFDTLASSAFRRGVRLFLPITASTFLSLIFELTHVYPREYKGKLPIHASTWPAQFYDWYLNLLASTNPFQMINPGNPIPQETPYDVHLWTIPYEFRGSMVVFLTLLAIAKTKNSIKTFFLGMFVLYTLWIGQWDLGLFLGGAFLAELQFLRRDLFPSHSTSLLSPPSTTSTPPRPRPFLLKYSKLFLHLLTIPLFFAGLYLISIPDQQPESTPGWRHIHAMTPPQYRTEIAPWYTAKFWGTVGSLILLVSLSFSPPLPFSSSPSGLLQLPFTNPLAQYLGDISYSLYMMHGPMLYSIGHYMRKHADSQPPEMFWWDFVKCVIVWGGATIWSADLFTRFIDSPSVGFGKWCAGRCWVENE